MPDEVILRIGSLCLPPMSRTLLAKHSTYFRAMFEGNFQEKVQDEVELSGVDHEAVFFLINLIVDQTNISSLTNISESKLIELFRTSNMLQFSSVQEDVSHLLINRISDENCFILFGVADLISDQKLLKYSRNYILYRFETVRKTTGLLKCNIKLLEVILTSPQLNVNGEFSIYESITFWKDDNPEERQEMFPELIRKCLIFNLLTTEEVKVIHLELNEHSNIQEDVLNILKSMKTSGKDEVNISPEVKELLKKNKFRRVPVIPCVVGFLTHKDKITDDTNDYHRKNRDLTPVILGYVPSSGLIEDVDQLEFRKKVGVSKSGSIVEVERLECIKDGGVSATGFQVTSGDEGQLLITGGEFSLGYSKWQKGVWLRQRPGKWDMICCLERVRRHHAALLVGGRTLFLIGGFGKHRIPLDNVEKIDLQSTTVTKCADLPTPIYSPAAVLLPDQERIMVVGRNLVTIYSLARDTWDVVQGVTLPQGVEFNRALNDGGNLVYLTSTHSKGLYKLDTIQMDRVELVGNFSRETANTCMIGGDVVNFSSEDFGDERVVEMFSNSVFSVLTQTESEEFDFSPRYCHGCLSLVHYQ